MRQLFPTPVDDVSVAETYAADARPAPDGRPWVMANMISSVDGAIEVAGVSGGLGGPGDKEVFSAIRGVPDYILVGSGTVIAENYRRPQTSPAQQAVRAQRGQRPLPQIVIVTGSLSIDADHRVFDPEARPIVATHANAPSDRREALGAVADVIEAGVASIDLPALLAELRARGGKTVLLEGGPTLNGAMVAADLVDEWCVSSAPVMAGGGTEKRMTAGTHTHEPRPMRLERTLVDEGYLFHRYVRTR